MATKVKRVRWECPNGLHPGVLGSTRPRANATVRYCLPCSEAAGVLVERTAPALERKRRVKVEAKRERKTTAKDRAQASLVERARIVCMDAAGREVVVDLIAEVEECARLLGVKHPAVMVRHMRNLPGTGASGRAWPEKRTVSFTFDRSHGIDNGSAEYLRALALHEVCHLADTRRVKQTKRGTRSRWHGPQFKRKLLDAARERWPQIVGFTDDRFVGTRAAYDLDEMIVDALKACTLLDAETAELAA